LIGHEKTEQPAATVMLGTNLVIDWKVIQAQDK